MSNEFEDLSSRLPDLGAVLAQRLAVKMGQTPTPPPGTVDPYQLMMQRKKGESMEIAPTVVQKWPEEDVKALEDYCARMGIMGFNCGKMNPVAALAMLKKQVGDFTGVPLEERVPEGYEKRGTPSAYGPNYPYTEAMRKKQILHG